MQERVRRATFRNVELILVLLRLPLSRVSCFYRAPTADALFGLIWTVVRYSLNNSLNLGFQVYWIISRTSKHFALHISHKQITCSYIEAPVWPCKSRSTRDYPLIRSLFQDHRPYRWYRLNKVIRIPCKSRYQLKHGLYLWIIAIWQKLCLLIFTDFLQPLQLFVKLFHLLR